MITQWQAGPDREAQLKRDRYIGVTTRNRYSDRYVGVTNPSHDSSPL